MAMNVEAENSDLKRRVSELEGSFRFLTREVSDVHKDLLAFEAKSEQRFKDVEANFGKVNGLREDLPGIVDDAMRAVLRETRGKSRKEP